jgi:hypothetical protein
MEFMIHEPESDQRIHVEQVNHGSLIRGSLPVFLRLPCWLTRELSGPRSGQASQ